jgi:NAD(P)-dependent dehydrogenase (short-subunit alcohol dehydrogenase family)
MSRFSGKTVVVTGASRGIGAALARRFAREGASVVVSANEQAAETIAAEIVASGGKAIAQIADVTSKADVVALYDAAEREFGGVDVSIQNAGVITIARIEAMTEAEWDKVMAVNTRGPFECVKAVVPVMRKQKYGKVVNIASGTLFKGTPHLMHYVASKGAVVAMTRVMARELGADNIMVNCIAPGLTLSPAVQATYSLADIEANKASRALKREEEPEDLSGALVFFCSGESDFITGQTLLVDGGSVMH